MVVWDYRTLCGFVLLSAGAVGQSVTYPDDVCAVRGSTVTFLCTFTPLKSVVLDGKEVPVEIIRVRWCRNHLICQGSTQSVYDSDPNNVNNNDPRYKYLGDKTENCSLQITDIQRGDEGTLRFRMEGNVQDKGHFTGQSGVTVRVVDDVPMRINSSREATKLPAGGAVTLYCTARCAFHQLEVTWFKDDHALSESGPALQLHPLTARDSGNYTCGLKTNSRTHRESRSQPYSLQVEAEQEEVVSLVAGLVSGVLLALLTLFALVAVACVIRRKRTANQRPATGDVEVKRPDNIDNNALQPAKLDGGGRRRESSLAVDEVNYSSVQFRHKNQARPAMEEEDAIIYSAVVSRG